MDHLEEVSHVKTPILLFWSFRRMKICVCRTRRLQRMAMAGKFPHFILIKKTGALTFINKQPTGGDHPCYVDVDKTGKWVFAGNYTSGSLSVLPVNKDGSLGAATAVIEHAGSGKNPERQEKPHVHCTIISPDNKWLYVPDLGIDKVMIYAFDETTGKLTGKTTICCINTGCWSQASHLSSQWKICLPGGRTNRTCCRLIKCKTAIKIIAKNKHLAPGTKLVMPEVPIFMFRRMVNFYMLPTGVILIILPFLKLTQKAENLALLVFNPR